MDYWVFLRAAVALCLLTPCFDTLAVDADAQGIGVNYGMKGDNLPSPDEVVALYTSKGIKRLRLFNPNPNVSQALQGSGIEVVLGTLNEDLQRLATDSSYANSWVKTNVLPYAKSVKFRYINAGNEVIPGNLSGHVLPAMQNLDAALRAANVGTIAVTTAISTVVLGTSYPPSQGAFSASAAQILAPIVAFLKARGSPLLVNVYPYFAYANDPNSIGSDYALFTANRVVVQDGQLGYKNLFDAMLDALYSALENTGGPNLEVVVSETGWPSAGGVGATVENARMYNNGVVSHVSNNAGTPKRPGKGIETYLFAMFNEDLKPAGTEQNFGLFQPDMREVYHVDFSA